MAIPQPSFGGFQPMGLPPANPGMQLPPLGNNQAPAQFPGLPPPQSPEELKQRVYTLLQLLGLMPMEEEQSMGMGMERGGMGAPPLGGLPMGSQPPLM